MDKTFIALAILGVAVILIGLTFILVSLLLVEASAQGSGYSYAWSVDGRSFDITLVASNVTSWERGLMNASITNRTIMIFVFPSRSIYPFWMYDTYSNLDMMWLNVTGGAGEGGTGRVVYIMRNATSCFTRSACVIYTPNALANYVIETKAGFVELNNVSVGSSVTLRRVAR